MAGLLGTSSTVRFFASKPFSSQSHYSKSSSFSLSPSPGVSLGRNSFGGIGFKKESDGLHLTESGNKIVIEEIVNGLKEGGVSVERLPVDLPLISELDPKDPLKALENLI